MSMRICLKGLTLLTPEDAISFHTNIPYNLDLAVILFFIRPPLFLLLLPNVASAMDRYLLADALGNENKAA